MSSEDLRADLVERYSKSWAGRLKKYSPAQAQRLKRAAGQVFVRNRSFFSGSYQSNYDIAMRQVLHLYAKRKRESAQRGAVGKCLAKGGQAGSTRNQQQQRGGSKPQRRRGGKRDGGSKQHGPRVVPCGHSQVQIKCKHCTGKEGWRPSAGLVYKAPADIPTIGLVAPQHKPDKITVEFDDKGGCSNSSHPSIAVYGKAIVDPQAPIPGPVLPANKRRIRHRLWEMWSKATPIKATPGRKVEIEVSPETEHIPFMSWFKPDRKFVRDYTVVLVTCGTGKQPLYGRQFLKLQCYPAETTSLLFKLNPGRSIGRKRSKDFVRGGKVHRIDELKGSGGLLKSKAHESTIKKESLKEQSGRRKGKVGKVMWTTRTKTVTDIKQSHAGGTSKFTKEQNSYQRKKKLGGDKYKGKATRSNTSDNAPIKRRGNAATALTTFTLTRGSRDKKSSFDMGALTAAIDALAATSTKIQDAINGLPKCGWYINWSLVFGEGSFGYDCGWKEAPKTHDVYWWWSANVAVTLAKINLEGGFGFQFSKVQAKVYLAFDGAFSIKGAVGSKPPPADAAASIEVKGSCTGAVGVVAEVGSIISATGKIQTGVEAIGTVQLSRGLTSNKIRFYWIGIGGTVDCKICWGIFSRSYVKNPLHPSVGRRALPALCFPELKEKKATAKAAK